MKLGAMMKTKSLFFAVGLLLIAPSTYASNCNQIAINAAEALYKINVPSDSNITASSHLVSGPVVTESGNVYVWEIKILENGMQKNSAYQIKAIDSDQCTVFEFSMPSAG